MANDKIRIKSSLAMRAVVVSLCLLVAPLFLHSLFLYWSEYKGTLADVMENLELTAKGQKAPAVWVLQADGTVERVNVQLGIRGDQYAELLSDTLKPGDQLAVALRADHHAAPSAQQPPRFGGAGRFR